MHYTTKLNSLESELKVNKEEKDKIDTSSANSFLIKTRNILRDIETIFIDTKEKKFDEFIEKLQTKSNNFFKTINIDAFTGTIVFTRRNKINRTIVEVELQEDGRTFYKPNQSLLTSMHIEIGSIVMTISFGMHRHFKIFKITLSIIPETGIKIKSKTTDKSCIFNLY